MSTDAYTRTAPLLAAAANALGGVVPVRGAARTRLIDALHAAADELRHGEWRPGPGVYLVTEAPGLRHTQWLGTATERLGDVPDWPIVAALTAHSDTLAAALASIEQDLVDAVHAAHQRAARGAAVSVTIPSRASQARRLIAAVADAERQQRTREGW